MKAKHNELHECIRDGLGFKGCWFGLVSEKTVKALAVELGFTTRSGALTEKGLDFVFPDCEHYTVNIKTKTIDSGCKRVCPVDLAAGVTYLSKKEILRSQRVKPWVIIAKYRM